MARNSLQDSFNRGILEALSFERLLAERISQRLVSHGIVLSGPEKKRLIRAIAARDPDAFTFKLPSTGDEIKIDLTGADSDWLSDRMKAASAQVGSLIEITANVLSNRGMKRLKHGWLVEAGLRRKESRGFESRLRTVWRQPFDQLDMLIAIADESGSNANAVLRRRRSKKCRALVEVLTRLHARACQVAREIAMLLRSGFGDGAIARWRTLHELAATSEFIRNGGEPLATRYLHFHAVEAKRAADQYMEWCGKRGERPLPKRLVRRIDTEFKNVIKTYGRPFANDYGWAAEGLGIAKPKFWDIEKGANVSFWRPDYRMASYNVHANPKGILFRLGLSTDDILLTGPSNCGLGDPGRNTSASLTPMTCNLVLMHPSLDSIVTAKIMLKLSASVERLFVETERRIQRRGSRGVLS